MEVEAITLTASLSKAGSDITQAAQNLEKTFKEVNLRQTGEEDIPDPIKLVLRLTSLEVALGHLKNECEVISKKRTEVTEQVIASQLRTVAQVTEMLDRTENDDPYQSQSDVLDQSWSEMATSLQRQHEIMTKPAN